jgi:hypothetical protein
MVKIDTFAPTEDAVFEKEDFTTVIDISSLETKLTKEQKEKCYAVVVEVAKYLKSDREKLYMIERLIMELENTTTAEFIMNALRSTRKTLVDKEISVTKKGLVL